MALETYRAKRDFETTPEPKGRKARKAGSSFVVQKHDATRLHYDFRLEMDGVLKSWAVTRGPSLVPGEKRLAVHVEDHPLEYGGFEGTIPKGEYGGGSVILWDRGTWKPIEDPEKGYAKGHLEFELDGSKLKGRWHLVRMQRRRGEKHDNWLLIKGEDEFARTESDPDILEERPESVKTGRKIEELAGEAPGWSSKTGRIPKRAPRKKAARSTEEEGSTEEGEATPEDPAPTDPATLKGARKGRLPDFVEPALATLVSTPPESGRYLHEVKFDGYRLEVRIEAGRVKLITRSGLDWTAKFGKEIVAAFAALPVATALIDGELVVETHAGASDFSALQADLSEGRTNRFLFYAFDLLHLDGYDLTAVPLVERKAALRSLIGAGNSRIRFSESFEASGAAVLRNACRLSLEGIVSKLRDAPYRGGRGKDWLKSKCSERQEFVIAGYVPSTAARHAIGSLSLGVHDKAGVLEPVGRVGTGFTASVATDLFRRLERLRIPESPFGVALTADEARQLRFVRPELVAEVEFRAWTVDGHLRHAAFRGLREDKPASEIVRERPRETRRMSDDKRTEPAPAAQRHAVKLTHPDRLYWPDEGVTKEGLADYYVEVWPRIAPFLVERPLALLRCPNGIGGESFFQKHAWRGASEQILLVQDPKEPAEEPLIAIDSLDGLIALVQAAALEIHPWGSTLAEWEKPDTLTLDLDPGDGVGWENLIEAAREVRARLEAAGLAAFVKTSGGKGLHVVAPLKPKAGWPEAKAFTKAIADAMSADSPDRYVATVTKAKRHGKILVDYLRNQRGATAVAAYSTRARPGATVSCPLAWEELDPSIRPALFTVATMPKRLAALAADPWADFSDAAAPLPSTKAKRGRAA